MQPIQLAIKLLVLASVVTAMSTEATNGNLISAGTTHERGLQHLQNQLENTQEEMPPQQKSTTHTPSPLFLQDSSPAKNGLRKIGMDMAKFSNLLQTVHNANGKTFTVENFLEHDAKPFVLSSYEVLAENAKLVRQNADGSETLIPRPKMVHLHGSIAGDSSSFVVMHLSPTGSLGLIETSSTRMSIESDPSGHSVLLDAETFKADTMMAEEIFAAEQEGMVPDELPAPAAPEQSGSADQSSSHIYNANTDGVVGDEEADANFQGGRQSASRLTQSARRGARNRHPTILVDAPHTTRKAPRMFLPQNNNYEIGIAIDCDQACVARLNQYAPGSGQGTDATSYLTALIAGTAVVYKRDIGRDIKITYMKLWDTASPFDSGTNSLSQYRNHYASNPPSEQYDVAHLMTGIQEGGVAYLGTVCNKPSNVGVSSIRGQWQGATSGSSAYMWDLEVTAHELGHNFGSGHSHDYSPPIDECVACLPGMTAAQCQAGGSAVGAVPSDDARCVKGTVMSYCHLCGGMTNINMNFHPRAITKIQGVLNNNCGVVTGPNAGGGASSAPTVAPTKAPTNAAITNTPTYHPTKAPTTPITGNPTGNPTVAMTEAPTNAPTDATINVTQSVSFSPAMDNFDDAARANFKKTILELLASWGITVQLSDITINEVSGSTELLQADAVLSEANTPASTTVDYSVTMPGSADPAQVTTELDNAAKTPVGSTTSALSSSLSSNGIQATSTELKTSAAATTAAPTMSGASANRVSLVVMIISMICSIAAWL